MKRLSFLLSFLLFLLNTNMGQTVSFEAYADARQVTVGGYFEVSFTLKNARGSSFSAPNFNNFEVLQGPSSSMSTQIINGKMTQETGYSYVLQPKKEGKFSIGSASIIANGKKYVTQPLTVEVIKGKAANNGAGLPEGEVFVRAELNTTEAYVGQQILVDYKLYTTVEIVNYAAISEPSYDGFYAEEVKRFSARTMREVIGGVQYTTKVLRRVALFPQQAGLLEIEPLKIQVAINEGGGRRSGFFFQRNTRPMNVETEALSFTVKQLPPNAPVSFGGAVGAYTMISSVSPNVLSTDDALTIQMTVAGNGDIKRLQPAGLPLGDTFEVYDPAIKNEVSGENQGQIICRKIFEYLALPKAPGQFVIEPAFTYFNPDSAKYITLKGNATRINVRKGSNATSNIATTTEKPSATADIRFIKTSTKLSERQSHFMGSGLFWILILLPILLLIGAFIYKRIITERGNLDLTMLKSQKAAKVAKKRLAQAKILMSNGDSREFYSEISNASLGYISDRLNIQTTGLTKNNVREKLNTLHVSETHIESFMQILQTAEMALFAGMDNAAAMSQTYENTIEVIQKIEGEIG